jgi:hypothetical protein
MGCFPLFLDRGYLVNVPGAMATMPQKPKKGRGRPKVQSALRSIVSLKASDDFEKWLDGLVKASESGTRANAIKRALRAFAEEQEYDDPIPER